MKKCACEKPGCVAKVLILSPEQNEEWGKGRYVEGQTLKKDKDWEDELKILREEYQSTLNPKDEKDEKELKLYSAYRTKPHHIQGTINRFLHLLFDKEVVKNEKNSKSKSKEVKYCADLLPIETTFRGASECLHYLWGDPKDQVENMGSLRMAGDVECTHNPMVVQVGPRQVAG